VILSVSLCVYAGLVYSPSVSLVFDLVRFGCPSCILLFGKGPLQDLLSVESVGAMHVLLWSFLDI
jgi:hypothetical protein